MGQQEALAKVYAKYGKDRVTYDPITRYATVEGVGRIYVGQKMTIRQRIVSDLCSSGMKCAEAVRLLNNKEKGEAVGSHYHAVLKSVDVQAYVDARLLEIADRAKTKLENAVEKAADNIVDLVDAGDYNASVKVLTGTGVLVNKIEKETNVTISFGKWLSAEQKEKTIESFAHGDDTNKTITLEAQIDDAELVDDDTFNLDSVEIEPLQVETKNKTAVVKHSADQAIKRPTKDQILAAAAGVTINEEDELVDGPSDDEFPNTMPLIDLGED